MNIIDIKKLLFLAPVKTVWFNFRYLPFKEAIKFPIILARNVSVRYCHKGFCQFDDGVKTGVFRLGFGDRLINVETNSSISIKGKLVIKGTGVHALGPGFTLGIGREGTLTIGDNFTASVRNRISCQFSITIGDDNMWSFDNVIMDSDTHQICDAEGSITNYNKAIIFGNHVWLGCRNIVMKGASIPDGCMVASGSKITSAYTEKNAIIASQNKVIKSNIIWKRDWAINI